MILLWFRMENSVSKARFQETIKFARLFLVKPNEAGPTNDNNSEILLESGKIEVEVEKDFITAEYSGSNLQKEWNGLQKNLLSVKRKGSLLDEEYEKAEKEKNEVVRDRLVSFDYPALFIEKQKILEAFIKKHPSSLISAYKFEDFAGDNIDLAIVEPVYKALDENLKTLAPVKVVAELIKIAQLTSPGKQAPEFSQTDTSGTLVSLSSFRGKYLLIDFWAGWCVPCRAENPNLKKIYQQFNSKGFEIVGVSLDGERKA